VGLIPMGINLLLALAFYAKKNYWIPTLASLISLSVNIILNFLLVFIFQYGAASLAISTSLAACFNTGFLFRKLSKEIGISLFVSTIFSSFKIVILSIISGLITLCVEYMVFNEASILILFGKIKMQFPRNFIEQVIIFFILSGSFIASFVSLAWILNMKELLNVFDITSKKILPAVK
jgi:putative peptidoglycan lipid II flippase